MQFLSEIKVLSIVRGATFEAKHWVIQTPAITAEIVNPVFKMVLFSLVLSYLLRYQCFAPHQFT